MLNTRIAELIKELGISRRKFAHGIGVDASLITKIINSKDEYKLSEKYFILIERVYNVNPQWLRHGVGAMFHDESSTKLKRSVLALVDDLTEEQAEAVLAFICYLKEAQRH